MMKWMICEFFFIYLFFLNREFRFGDANDADQTKEMYLELLEDELNRGPLEKIVNVATKMLTNASSLPEQIQNSAIVCLGEFFIKNYGF